MFAMWLKSLLSFVLMADGSGETVGPIVSAKQGELLCTLDVCGHISGNSFAASEGQLLDGRINCCLGL